MQKMSITPIILAAGNSTRFGSNKLLFGIEGKPLYRHAVDAVLAVCAKGDLQLPVLVTQYDEVAQQVADLPLTVVRNPNPDRGLSSSVICGVQATPADHACLFLTADQPCLTAETLRSFVQGYQKSGCLLGCVAYGNRTGNPTVFAPCYRADLLTLTGDVGGKILLKQHMEQVYLHQTAEKELADIDLRPQTE